VKFLLGLVSLEGAQDKVSLLLIWNFVAGHVVGDVIDQAVEEEDLEVLVVVDELDAGEAQGGDGSVRGSTTVGKGTMGCILYCGKLCGAKLWEAIGQGVDSWGSGFDVASRSGKSGAEESDGSENGVHCSGL